MKQHAESLTEVRDTAITVSALIAAERNPRSHLIQTLIYDLQRKQRPDGSWNEELWDTVWATKALAVGGCSVQSDAMKRALSFIEATRDPIAGTWYEEPFETMLVLDLIAEIAPQRLAAVGTAALQWISSLQRADGCVVGIRYTGMAVSLLRSAQELGIPVDQNVIPSALEYIKGDSNPINLDA